MHGLKLMYGWCENIQKANTSLQESFRKILPFRLFYEHFVGMKTFAQWQAEKTLCQRDLF